MSRIGIKPIAIPNEVKVSILEGEVRVEGPKGVKNLTFSKNVHAVISGDTIRLSRTDDSIGARSNHGLYRALLASAIQGVSQGYEIKLEVNGVGFKVQLTGNDLIFSLGYSHPLRYTLPQGVEAAIETNIITLASHDKQLIGRTAAGIRALRPPEPYKGKGIKYLDETITHKTGKSTAADSTA